MLPSVIEIGSPNLYLSKTRGFLSIKDDQGQLSRIPLDNIGVLLLTSPKATLSTALLNTLSERGIVAVLCDKKHRPASYLYPLQPHEELAGRLFDQIDAGKPLKKRLWQSIVKNKIANQAWLLAIHGKKNAIKLHEMSDDVLTGDKENKEAQAARLYWQSLFGNQFKRLPKDDGINKLLDFGYGILRSACLRAIAGSGLNPSLGLAHHSRRNPFCLADDIMEPLRPVVDALVYQINLKKIMNLNTSMKRYLANLISLPLKTNRGHAPLGRALNEMTQSLVRSYANKKRMLLIPTIPRNLHKDISKLWAETDFN